MISSRIIVFFTMHKMIEYRRSTPRDFEAIAALDSVAWNESKNGEFIPDGQHAWREWSEHALVILAWDDDKLVGTFLAFRCLDPHLFCLHKIFVDKAYRGQGIGNKLLEVSLAQIDEMNASIYLAVDPINAPALKLYEQWGFLDRKFVKGYYREIEDRFILTRRAVANRPLA